MSSLIPKDTVARYVTGFHRSVFKATNGRLLGRMAGMPVVMLTTTGRKSGKPRTTMLTSPARNGDSVVLVASYGGDDRHPTCFLNLRDDPEVEVVMQGRHSKMRARVATAEEKQVLWPKVTEVYRGYAGRRSLESRREPGR